MAGTGTTAVSIGSSVNPSTLGQGVVWSASVTGAPSLAFTVPEILPNLSGFTSTSRATAVASPFLAIPRLFFGDPLAVQISPVVSLGFASTGSTAVNLATAYYGFVFKNSVNTSNTTLCEIVDTAGNLKARLSINGSGKIVYSDSTGTAQGTGVTNLGNGSHTLTCQVGTGTAATFVAAIDNATDISGTLNSGTVNNGGIRLGSSTVTGTYITAYGYIAIASDTYPFRGPTGTVQFQVDGVNFGSAASLVASEINKAVVDCSLPVTTTSGSDFALSTGSHTITAIYNGDGVWNTASTSLTQSLSPSVAGLQHNTAVPSLANAGVNPLIGDQTGSLLTNPQVRIPTFGSSSTYFTLVTNATDIATISGSASKTIKVLRIWLQLTASANAPAFQRIDLYRRSSANTGGTPNSMSIPLFDTSNPAVTATANYYTANPSTLGTAAGFMTVLAPYMSTASVNGGPFTPVVIDFTAPGMQPFTLRGVSQLLALNVPGALPAGAAAAIGFIWTEDDS